MLPYRLDRLFLCLFALALGACSSNPMLLGAKVDQSGTLKVHPGLLGQPVPPELQQDKDTPRSDAATSGSSSFAKAAGFPGANGSEAGPQSGPRASENEIHFDFKEATIRPEYETLLQAHARRIAQNPNIRVRIEGNADERGPENLNKHLGMQRAVAVKQALVALGAAEKQIRAVSLGESKPKVSGHDETSWAENRRAEIIYEKQE